MNDVASNPGTEVTSAVPFAVVVFGRGEGGKPHASLFEPADAALAEQAAGTMGMRALRLATPEQQGLGVKLPVGRIFGRSGKAFVPFCAAAVFDQLEADPNAFSPERPPEADVPLAAPRKPKGARSAAAARVGIPDAQNATSRPGEPPADRAAITVGHRVLAAEVYDAELWYLAEVTALKGPDLLELRWSSEQWADEPPFVRHREHVALLPLTAATPV